MRVRLLNLLLVAALALAGARLGALLRQPPPALPPVEPAPAAGPEGAPAGEAPKAAQPPESYDVIVARDLFSPTRGVVAPAPVVAARPAPKPPPPKLTLYGVVILDGERSAFLQEGGAPDARPRKVRERDNIAGGTVTAIRPDGVTFVYGGTETVIPLRGPKEAGPPQPPAAAGAGAPPNTAASTAANNAAAARIRAARRPQPLPVVPGQMPVGGGGALAPDAGATGMPEFPAGTEPGDETGMPEDPGTGESVDGAGEDLMPIGEAPQ